MQLVLRHQSGCLELISDYLVNTSITRIVSGFHNLYRSWSSECSFPTTLFSSWLLILAYRSNGADRQTRTVNPRITSAVHYQLCYTSIYEKFLAGQWSHSGTSPEELFYDLLINLTYRSRVCTLQRFTTLFLQRSCHFNSYTPRGVQLLITPNNQ